MAKNWNHETLTKNSIHHHPILSPIPISIPIFLPIFTFHRESNPTVDDVSASDLQWKEKDRPRIHRPHSHLISSSEMVGFFSLCLCRKKVVSSSSSPTKRDQDENTKKSRDRFARETEESIDDNDEKEEEEEEETQKKIPLPPGMANKKASAEADSVAPTNYRKTRTKSMAAMPSSSSSSSSKKLLVSLSMKVRPGGKKGKVLKHEDSIWKKTIILGERCRVPDEEDDAVCHDENGNRISTYHPRLSNSVPVSRQNSFIDEDAIPKRHRHRHRREGNCSSSSSATANN